MSLLNVMVVDDDIDDTTIIKETIADVSPQHAVICINKSERVFDQLDSMNYNELPSLVIVDYNMPVITGVALLKGLKSDQRYKHIPVAVYSNSTFFKHKEECLEAGACIYLSKANTVSSIEENIKQILSHCL